MTRCHLCGRWLLWMVPWVHFGEYHTPDGATLRWHAAHLFNPVAGWRQLPEEHVAFITPDGLR